MDLTGERWVPGKSDTRIEGEHVARYDFAATFAKGKRILDIACGAGAGSYRLARHADAKSVLGVDIDQESIDAAKGAYEWPNLTFVRGDLITDVPREQFDLVVCFETIEHVDDDAKALRNLATVLTPGGILVLSTPNRRVTSPRADTINDKPDNPFHRREYLLPELERVITSAGFDIDQVNGQRYRTYFPSGTANMFADMGRRLVGYRPDFDASPVVAPFQSRLLTPRNWVIVGRKRST